MIKRSRVISRRRRRFSLPHLRLPRLPKLTGRFNRSQILGGVMLVLLFIGLWQINQLFRVRHLDFSFVQLWCDNPTQIRTALRNWQGVEILDQFVAMNEKFSRQFQCVDQVEVVKKLPNRLEIKVYGRQPLLVIDKESSQGAKVDLTLLEATSASQTAWLDWSRGAASEQNHFWVDATGLVFGQASESGTPAVRWVDDEIQVGKRFPIQQVNDLAKLLQSVGPIELARINEADNLLIELKDGQRLVFSLNHDLNVQLASLQLIQQKSKIESSRVDFVDLRFSKPVVRYGKSRLNGQR